MARKGSKPDNGAPETITIKKYANRRLYNTAESSYVTLEDLAKMVQQSVDFTVHDAKTGDDITRPSGLCAGGGLSTRKPLSLSFRQ